MVNDSDYRLYLENKFEGLTKHLHAQFENVHERLEEIKIQTTKTNGRVTILEKDFLTHLVNCNPAKEITEIKKDLEEYKMIKKYPKVFIGMIVILVVITLISVVKTTQVPNQLKNMEDIIRHEIRMQEGVSKVTRGGYVKFNDQGLGDSIKIK
jgi:hypothetical protein